MRDSEGLLDGFTEGFSRDNGSDETPAFLSEEDGKEDSVLGKGCCGHCAVGS